MAVLARRPGHGLVLSSDSAAWHLLWFGAVSAVSFLVPAVFSSLLDLQHDVYYLVYFAVTLGMLAAYVTSSGFDVVERLRSRWQLSLAVGAIAAAFVVWSVVARLDSTPHPDGLYFAFEIAWRGAVYGIVDALLLSAFPGLVALALMRHDIARLGRRVIYGALTLALVVVITGVYHLGFEDLRNKDVLKPELGNSVISLPVIISANPAGSIIAHTSMHLAAVTHAYESKDRLPPQTFVSKDYPDEVQLGDADQGAAVTLEKGGKLLIALTSNPSTGYGWVVVERAGPALDLVDGPRYVPPGSTTPVVGAPGTEVLTFEATEAGSFDLVLEYRRSFEPDAPAARMFEVKVEVR